MTNCWSPLLFHNAISLFLTFSSCELVFHVGSRKMRYLIILRAALVLILDLEPYVLVLVLTLVSWLLDSRLGPLRSSKEEPLSLAGVRSLYAGCSSCHPINGVEVLKQCFLFFCWYYKFIFHLLSFPIRSVAIKAVEVFKF